MCLVGGDLNTNFAKREYWSTKREHAYTYEDTGNGCLYLIIQKQKLSLKILDFCLNSINKNLIENTSSSKQFLLHALLQNEQTSHKLEMVIFFIFIFHFYYFFSFLLFLFIFLFFFIYFFYFYLFLFIYFFY